MFCESHPSYVLLVLDGPKTVSDSVGLAARALIPITPSAISKIEEIDVIRIETLALFSTFSDDIEKKNPSATKFVNRLVHRATTFIMWHRDHHSEQEQS